MNNPVLQSEGFERAAYNLTSAISGGMRTDAFDDSVRNFERAVARLALIMGMQAENDIRKLQGKMLAYDEQAFLNT